MSTKPPEGSASSEKAHQPAHRLTDRAATALALAALCGVVLTFYYRLWLPGLVLTKRDAFRFFLPLKQYMIERLSAGELPQWFPYEAFGRPFIGIPVTGVFHPFTLLYFVFSVPDAYRISTLLSCLLGALGAFALARTLAVSYAGAVFTGLAYACSGYVVSLTENLTYLYSIALLPLFCAVLDGALARGAPWVVGAALLWASVFLNGDVQTGYYYAFVALAWALMRRPDSALKAMGRFVCVAGLAGVVAAVQLAPTAAVFADSYRTRADLFQTESLVWSTHPLRLLTVVAAPVGGHAFEWDVAHQFFGGRPPGKNPVGFWVESMYVGVAVVGLAVQGALRRRDLRGLVALGAVALILALGRYGGLYELFAHVVPLWSAFRYPERLIGIVTFVLAIFAGAGLDDLRRRDQLRWGWFGAAGFCAAVWLGLRTAGAGPAAAASFGASSDVASEVVSSAASAFLVSAGVALAMGVGTAGPLVRRLSVNTVALLVLLMVTLDLWRVNQPAYHTGPVEAARFTPGLAQAVLKHSGISGPGGFRLLTVDESEFPYPAEIDQWLDTSGRISLLLRQVLDLEHNAEFHLESVKIYLPGYSPQVKRLLDLLSDSWGYDAYARLNVRYFLGRATRFREPSLARHVVAAVSDYDIALLKNPVRPKPRAYLSLKPEAAAGEVDLRRLMTRPDFLSGEVDVVELAEGRVPDPPTEGRVELERYAPEEVRVRVRSSTAAVLILLDAFENGWQATIDQAKTVPIMRANGLARAVIVPAGEHVVTFIYATPFLKVGALASALGVLLCGVLLAASALHRGQWPRASSGVAC